MLAEHGLVHDLRIAGLTLVVPIDSYPVHRPPLDDLLGSDHGHIVFRLASNHAGTAPDAGRKIDGHAPACALVLVRFVERRQLFVCFASLGFARIVRQGPASCDIPPGLRVMSLGSRQFDAPAGRLHRRDRNQALAGLPGKAPRACSDGRGHAALPAALTNA